MKRGSVKVYIEGVMNENLKAMIEKRAPIQDDTSCFIAQRCKWVIVKNRNYEKLRVMDGYKGFADIPQVDADATNVKNGVLGLGARRADIIEIENASF